MTQLLFGGVKSCDGVTGKAGLAVPQINCCCLHRDENRPKTQNQITSFSLYRLNFYAIYHSSRYISTFGLGGHIAISGCRSLSQSLSFISHFIFHIKFITRVKKVKVNSELAMVKNPRFAVGNEHICCSST